MLNEMNRKETYDRPFRRVSGGTGFADAIFRTSSDSRDYAEGMLRRVLRKEGQDEESIQMVCRFGMYLFMKGQELLLILTERDVEIFRSVGIHALEDFLLRELLPPGPVDVEDPV